jgi:cytochrome P450
MTDAQFKARDEAWSRQRRIVAPALNERISPEVWRESIEQASSLADLLSASLLPSASEPAQTILGLRTIAINVLARIAYGHHKPFALPSSSRKPSSEMTYVDAISLVTELLVPAAFLPARLLKLPVMPQILQTLGAALTKLPELTRAMLDQERKTRCSTFSDSGQRMAVTSDERPNTIMSTLVRLSDQETERSDVEISVSSEGQNLTTGGSDAGSSYLTEEEIAGNLFVFTSAGFDTTANTMAFAVTLLAAYPEWQAWIQNEIEVVLGSGNGLDSTDYATAFPQLTRCLAVMVSAEDNFK